MQILNRFFRPKLIVGTLPVTLTNGTTADATQVMSDLNWVVNQVNANAAPLASPTFTGTVTTDAISATNITASGTIAVTGASTLASVAGAVVATQADQETSTSVATVVTPGRQQFHPSAAKGWCKCGVTGNVLASYNVTSVTDVGTGIATVVWETDFSSNNYAIAAVMDGKMDCWINTPIAGSTPVTSMDTTTGTATDPTAYNVVAFGDQA